MIPLRTRKSAVLELYPNNWSPLNGAKLSPGPFSMPHHFYSKPTARMAKVHTDICQTGQDALTRQAMETKDASHFSLTQTCVMELIYLTIWKQRTHHASFTLVHPPTLGFESVQLGWVSGATVHYSQIQRDLDHANFDYPNTRSIIQTLRHSPCIHAHIIKQP